MSLIFTWLVMGAFSQLASAYTTPGRQLHIRTDRCCCGALKDRFGSIRARDEVTVVAVQRHHGDAPSRLHGSAPSEHHILTAARRIQRRAADPCR
jgi:hypothetical protein